MLFHKNRSKVQQDPPSASPLKVSTYGRKQRKGKLSPGVWVLSLEVICVEAAVNTVFTII